MILACLYIRMVMIAREGVEAFKERMEQICWHACK